MRVNEDDEVGWVVSAWDVWWRRPVQRATPHLPPICRSRGTSALHVDIRVDDADAAERAVIAPGPAGRTTRTTGASASPTRPATWFRLAPGL